MLQRFDSFLKNYTLVLSFHEDYTACVNWYAHVVVRVISIWYFHDGWQKSGLLQWNRGAMWLRFWSDLKFFFSPCLDVMLVQMLQLYFCEASQTIYHYHYFLCSVVPSKVSSQENFFMTPNHDLNPEHFSRFQQTGHNAACYTRQLSGIIRESRTCGLWSHTFRPVSYAQVTIASVIA